MHNSETVSTLPKPQPQPSEEAPANALRIWAISEYYFPNFSGAAIQAHRVLGALVNRGHQVCVLTTQHEAHPYLGALVNGLLGLVRQ